MPQKAFFDPPKRRFYYIFGWDFNTFHWYFSSLKSPSRHVWTRSLRSFHICFHAGCLNIWDFCNFLSGNFWRTRFQRNLFPFLSRAVACSTAVWSVNNLATPRFYKSSSSWNKLQRSETSNRKERKLKHRKNCQVCPLFSIKIGLKEWGFWRFKI